MNKKFMLVALMAALSTVGYAGNFKLPNNSVGGPLNAVVQVDKTNENFGAVSNAINGLQDSLEGKADANNVYSKNDADKTFVKKDDLNNDFASKDELDSLKTQVGNNTAISTENSRLVGELKGENETQQGQIDKNITDIGNIKTELENKVDKDNVYTKDEVNEALNGKVDEAELDNIYGAIAGNTTQITDEIKAREEGDKNLQTQIDTNKKNQADKDAEQDKEIDGIKAENTTQNGRLNNLENANNIQNGRLDNHEARITHLEDRVDRLDDKMNEGLSLMAAMNAVDFQNVQAGEMAIGAGFGHYGNAQSVALGVAYSPVEDFTVNAKYSVTAGNPESFAIGAGASYKFKVGR